MCCTRTGAAAEAAPAVLRVRGRQFDARCGPLRWTHSGWVKLVDLVELVDLVDGPLLRAKV